MTDRTKHFLWKKGIKDISLCLKDILRYTPMVLWGKLGASIVEGTLTVLQPLVIAEIFQIVPKLDPSHAESFWQAVAMLCFCVGLPSICFVFTRAMALYNDSRKESCYGWKLFEHAQKIRLEALEDPAVLNNFQKALVSYSDQAAGSRLLSCMLMIVEAFLVCVSTVFVVGGFSLWLVPGAVLSFLPHLWVRLFLEKKRTVQRREQSPLQRRLGYLWGLFSRKESVKEMRTMGFEGFLRKLWAETNIRGIEERKKLELQAVKLEGLDGMVKNICYAANVALTLCFMVKGIVSVGEFAASLTAFTILQNELMKLGDKISDFFDCYHYVEEYYDFFRTETDEDVGAEYQPFQREINMQNVCFRYPGSSEDALKGVNLSIKKGEHVVIVGVNGSGKTTLSRVLTGAYLAREGSVRYDGQNVAELKRSGLYRDISLVQQDFVHYHFTLRENIFISDLRYRKDEKRLQDVMEAAGMQELSESVGGPDTLLGREFGGTELSGGEWQKIAIARGLFKDCGLIVLDEPTASLDPLVEYDVLTKFMSLIRNKTAVIISHRVGICRMAQKIVVMRDGAVVECGTHEELEHAGGEYSRIWKEQARWY